MRRKGKQWHWMTETKGETVGRRETGNCVSFRGTSGKGLAMALVTLQSPPPFPKFYHQQNFMQKRKEKILFPTNLKFYPQGIGVATCVVLVLGT